MIRIMTNYRIIIRKYVRFYVVTWVETFQDL
jgi:hypothetical protein